VVEEHIYHDAGATTPEAVKRAELVQWIRDAGRIPVERDTLYNVVREFAPNEVPEAAMKVRDRKAQKHLAVIP